VVPKTMAAVVQSAVVHVVPLRATTLNAASRWWHASLARFAVRSLTAAVVGSPVVLLAVRANNARTTYVSQHRRRRRRSHHQAKPKARARNSIIKRMCV